MITMGIDVVIMTALAFVAVIGATIVACFTMMDQDTGVAVINTAALTGLTMVIGYVLMAKVLDYIVSIM
jgi:hypothetical protein